MYSVSESMPRRRVCALLHGDGTGAPLHSNTLLPSGELDVLYGTAGCGVVLAAALFVALLDAGDRDDGRFRHEFFVSQFTDFFEIFSVNVVWGILHLDRSIPVCEFQLGLFADDGESPRVR